MGSIHGALLEIIRFINRQFFFISMISRKRSKRKASGGIYVTGVPKPKSAKANEPTNTKIAATKRKSVRTRGGTIKQRLLTVNEINLFDGKTYVKAVLKNVVENGANSNFVRQNILTKGAVIETDKGKARITNRPGQEGTVNAVLV